MTNLNFFSGGFPMSTDRLASMQSCWQELWTALAQFVGPSDSFVVSGCGTYGSADGYIVIRGQLYEHVAGTGVPSTGGVALLTETTTLADESGENQTFSTRTYAKSFIVEPTSTAGYVAGSWTKWADISSKFYTLHGLAEELTANSVISSLQSSLEALTQKVAALEAASGSTSADLSSITNNLSPKGSIILWPKSICIPAYSKEMILGSLPYGYIPCHSYSLSTYTTTQRKAHIEAWNEYFEHIGLTDSARFSTSATAMDFTLIQKALGLPEVNMDGRFALGPSSYYTRLSTGGESSHTLTLSEMPAHTHAIETVSSTKASTGDSKKIVSTGSTAATTATLGVNSVGSSQPHNNMPPYLALNYIMKVL